jgi:hypothetical protein
LVYSIHDPTEVAIQKMIDASQRMITMNNQGQFGGMSPPQKRHLELQIKTLENAPRDAEKLERLLKAKRRQKEEAIDIEDTQRLVTEIEMLNIQRLFFAVGLFFSVPAVFMTSIMQSIIAASKV